VKSRVERLEDYIGLLAGLDSALGDLNKLEELRTQIESQLESISAARNDATVRIDRLESQFKTLIESFKVPRLEGPEDIRIDARTYLPIIYGRRFDELSSQGLQVLVNLAHTLAHHLTSISLGLGLPQILFIDGLTSNLGHEGDDLGRVNAVYDYLIEVSIELGDLLQIVVADNDVPEQAREYVRLELSEEDRLIRR
jgi:hypothetical protein